MPKSGIDNIDEVFLSRVRLGIVSALIGGDELDFKTLRGILQTTDGNLGSHLRKLEEVGFLKVRKRFIGRKPNTSYIITETGRAAFAAHVKKLEMLLHGSPSGLRTA